MDYDIMFSGSIGNPRGFFNTNGSANNFQLEAARKGLLDLYTQF